MPGPSTKPVFHYLDIGSLGRGEIVRLFLKDAGIDFEDVRYPFDDTWPQSSAKLQEKGISRTGKVPVLEYNGVVLRQHIPILRYLARDMGRYDGQTSVEKYVVDAVADVYIDWRSQWAANLNKVSDEYKESYVPNYYAIISSYYDEREGPFLLGSTITYTDFAIYQSIDNDEKIGTLPEKLPESMKKLKEAFERRESVKAYLASRS